MSQYDIKKLEKFKNEILNECHNPISKLNLRFRIPRSTDSCITPQCVVRIECGQDTSVTWDDPHKLWVGRN